MDDQYDGSLLFRISVDSEGSVEEVASLVLTLLESVFRKTRPHPISGSVQAEQDYSNEEAGETTDHSLVVRRGMKLASSSLRDDLVEREVEWYWNGSSKIGRNVNFDGAKFNHDLRNDAIS